MLSNTFDNLTTVFKRLTTYLLEYHGTPGVKFLQNPIVFAQSAVESYFRYFCPWVTRNVVLITSTCQIRETRAIWQYGVTHTHSQNGHVITNHIHSSLPRFFSVQTTSWEENHSGSQGDIAALWIKLHARPWWRHGMAMVFASLPFCECKPVVTGGFPSQRASNSACFLIVLSTGPRPTCSNCARLREGRYFV